MGVSGDSRARASGARAFVCALAATASLLLLAPAAFGASPLKLREVYPGSTLAAGAEYVELQMTAPGQNDVDGQVLRFYDAGGAETSSFPLSSDVADGSSQRRILFATAEAAGVGATSPDFTLSSADRISAAGGAVCFTGSTEDDCVTWGAIPVQSAPFPDPQSSDAAAIADTKALVRSIAPGCSTFLDPADDSGNSSADFAQIDPGPQRNSSIPSEAPCAPDTFITTFPANPTSDTQASFTYDESPADYEPSFECALDWAGVLDSGDFTPCSAEGAGFAGPLADGTHRFAVRATTQGGTDPSPDTHSWTVDSDPPQTTIDSTPPNPNSGFAVNFEYSSDEPFSSFRCQLDGQPAPAQVCGASSDSGSKSYFGLAEGTHTFRVWAIDNAGNPDPTPAEHVFQVITSIGDTTPPDTSILAAPANPSRSSAASFAYVSSEPGSSFQCSLNAAPFVPCSPAGASYANLPNGPYSFAVRAIDRAGNVDSVPATHGWTIAATAPSTRFTKAPSGAVRAKGKAARVSFGFAASEPGSSFRCRLDLEGAFKPCSSPLSFKAKAGRHVFEVFAVDRLGNQGASAFRIFNVRAKGAQRAFFTQSGRFLSSLSAEISPTKLPREGLRPVSLRFASTFENLDGSDIPPLRRMTLRLASGGVVNSRGLPRCSTGQLALRSSAQALRACKAALVGQGAVSTAIRFPEGARIRAEAKLLLFNAGNRLLMHIHTTVPVQGTFLVPLKIRKTKGRFGTVLSAKFPPIAADFGQVTGFEMKLERRYRFKGKRRSYLLGGCPIPKAAGLNRLAFELARVEYRFAGGLRIRNSTINSCRATG
ncbi:MAG: hypothetical protein WDZ46_03320 [Solirubrobacterales bacterium]